MADEPPPRRWKLAEGRASAPAYSRVQAVQEGHTVIVSIHGELDMDASARIARQLLDALAPPTERVVLDLADVSFIDSSGLGVLNMVRVRAVDADVRLTLRRVSRPVLRVLELSGMDFVFEIEP